MRDFSKAVNSSLKCNSLGHQLRRRTIVEAFVRSAVQACFHAPHCSRGKRAKIPVLGKILAQQAVEVFVATAFPRARRMRKVDAAVERALELAELRELHAVVLRERGDVQAVPATGRKP